MLNWWMSAVPIGYGGPSGLPPAAHWPGGKGYWRQPARAVRLIEEIRTEWQYRTPPKQAAPKPKPKPTGKRRAS